MAVLAGKLEARREDCAPVAGKSTLNRMERSRLQPTHYHKISHNPVAIKNLMGKSGRAMVEALIAGETNPVKLASLAHRRVKASQEEGAADKAAV